MLHYPHSPKPKQTWIISLFPEFHIEWLYGITQYFVSLHQFLSPRNKYLGFLCIFSWIDCLFLYIIQWYSILWIYYNLSIYLLKNILVASKFWQLLIKMQLASMSMFVYVDKSLPSPKMVGQAYNPSTWETVTRGLTVAG
jgi:hypothetical protein